MLRIVLLLLSFSGAAFAASQQSERGPVKATVSLSPETLRIGDIVELNLRVEAQANVELLMPEFGNSLERFSILEFVPREEIDTNGNSIATQLYRLQMLSSGEFKIPPIAIEFVDHRPGQREAPQDEDSYELLTKAIPFSVASVLPKDARAELAPPLGPLPPLANPLVGTSDWLYALLMLACFGALIAWWWWQQSRSAAVQQSAYDRALQRLTVLRDRPLSQESDLTDFFIELSDIVRRYLEERFHLHAPELTTEEFLDIAASSPDLDTAKRQFLQSFLQSADRVKFARHVPNANDASNSIQAVEAFLSETGQEEAQEKPSASDLSTKGAQARV